MLLTAGAAIGHRVTLAGCLERGTRPADAVAAQILKAARTPPASPRPHPGLTRRRHDHPQGRGTQLFRSLRLFLRYLNLAYPARPADYPGYMTALAAKLREPGRMAEFMKTFKSTPADAEKQLPNIRCPALVIMGTLDPDFAGPQAEGEAIVEAMPAGASTVAMVDGAGHYPHAQSPEAVAELVIAFLKEHAGA